MPQVKFSFVELANLETVEPASMCDVIGVIKEVGDISQITSKATQKPVRTRLLPILRISYQLSKIFHMIGMHAVRLQNAS